MSLLLWIAFSIIFIEHALLSSWTCVFLFEIFYIYLYRWIFLVGIWHRLTQWLYLLQIIQYFSTKSILFSFPLALFLMFFLRICNILHTYILFFAFVYYYTFEMSYTECYLFIHFLFSFFVGVNVCICYIIYSYCSYKYGCENVNYDLFNIWSIAENGEKNTVLVLYW